MEELALDAPALWGDALRKAIRHLSRSVHQREVLQDAAEAALCE